MALSPPNSKRYAERIELITQPPESSFRGTEWNEPIRDLPAVGAMPPAWSGSGWAIHRADDDAGQWILTTETARTVTGDPAMAMLWLWMRHISGSDPSPTYRMIAPLMMRFLSGQDAPSDRMTLRIQAESNLVAYIPAYLYLRSLMGLPIISEHDLASLGSDAPMASARAAGGDSAAAEQRTGARIIGPSAEQVAENQAQMAPPPTGLPDIDELLAPLNALVGLQEIKQEISAYASYLHVQRLRQQAGKTSARPNLHMALLGAPGTGKTTVARIIGQLMFRIGMTTQDVFVEAQRSDLIAEYVGQTGPKIRRLFDQARGGVLFIDEAYGLTAKGRSGSGPQFEEDALNELMTLMENYRSEVVIIFAGYSQPMRELLESNPGFRSRVTRVLEFPDYTTNELVAIGELTAQELGYQLDEGAQDKLRSICVQMLAQTGDHFGNGRDIRTLLEQASIRHASRLVDAARLQSRDDIDGDELDMLRADDLTWKADRPSKNPLGFAA